MLDRIGGGGGSASIPALLDSLGKFPHRLGIELALSRYSRGKQRLGEGWELGERLPPPGTQTEPGCPRGKGSLCNPLHLTSAFVPVHPSASRFLKRVDRFPAAAIARRIPAESRAPKPHSAASPRSKSQLNLFLNQVKTLKDEEGSAAAKPGPDPGYRQVPSASSLRHRRARCTPSGFPSYLRPSAAAFVGHLVRGCSSSLLAGTRPRLLLNYILTRLIRS